MSQPTTVKTSLWPSVTDEGITLFVGEAKAVLVQVLGRGGLPYDLTGIVDAASQFNTALGAAISTPAVSVDDASNGVLSVAFGTSSTSAERHAARLTIALNFGASRDQTTRPIPVEVIAR